jgi:hypothetical protein
MCAARPKSHSRFHAGDTHPVHFGPAHPLNLISRRVPACHPRISRNGPLISSREFGLCALPFVAPCRPVGRQQLNLMALAPELRAVTSAAKLPRL